MSAPFNNRGAWERGDQSESLEWLLQLLGAQQTQTAGGPQQNTTGSTSTNSIPAASQRQPDVLSLLQELFSQQQTQNQLTYSQPTAAFPPGLALDSSLLYAALAAQNAAPASSLETSRAPPAPHENESASNLASQLGLLQNALPYLFAPPSQQITVPIGFTLQNHHPSSEHHPQHRAPATAPVPSEAALLQALSMIIQQQQSAPSQQSPQSTVQLAAAAAGASQQQISQPPPPLPTQLYSAQLASRLFPRQTDPADVGAVATLYGSSTSQNEAHLTSAAGDGQLPRVKQRRRYIHESFPEKLYRMLQESAAAGKQDILSFTSTGRAFRIHRPDHFCEEILPNYFRHKRYDSFKRQLSMYGFQRIPIGPDEGSFEHHLFQLGRPELCRNMKRVTEILGQEDTDAGGGTKKPGGLKRPPPTSK